MRSARRSLLLEGLALGGLVVAQVLLFGRLVGTDTDYDEGVYLTSVDALEHGQKLGEDVFAPQPPGFYLLLRLISALGADSVRGFHWGMVGVAVATCLAAYLLGRAMAGPLAGLGASGLLTIAPSFTLIAHQVLADVPPLTLSLFAFWLAWEAQKRPRVGSIAAAAGATMALAVAVKPNAALALPTFLLLLLWRSSQRERAFAGALGGAAAISAVLLFAYRDVLNELWQSVVVYHRDARDTPAVVDRSHELATFLSWKTPFAWLVVAGLAASLLLLRRRNEPVWALWVWAAVSFVFVAFHQPLHHNHLVVLPVALATPAAIGLVALARRVRPEAAALGVFAFLLVAGYVQQHRRLTIADVPEQPELVAAAETLRRVTNPNDLVVSDQPIVPFLADRVVWGPLVDTANLRFQTGSLTDEEVLRELDEGNVRAVVVGRAFKNRPVLLAELHKRYRRVSEHDGVEVLVR
jgi:4-amino-4-deoxy-L-arabinose transferase-like glycosyltransferase